MNSRSRRNNQQKMLESLHFYSQVAYAYLYYSIGATASHQLKRTHYVKKEALLAERTHDGNQINR